MFDLFIFVHALKFQLHTNQFRNSSHSSDWNWFGTKLIYCSFSNKPKSIQRVTRIKVIHKLIEVTFWNQYFRFCFEISRQMFNANHIWVKRTQLPQFVYFHITLLFACRWSESLSLTVRLRTTGNKNKEWSEAKEIIKHISNEATIQSEQRIWTELVFVLKNNRHSFKSCIFN